ncbi:hypothetical protein KR100_10285 [Synechococcus sp. KORDI-100]|nr:hypothetical protein KR100_10285 [Synechococcus sp. KORDI-100]
MERHGKDEAGDLRRPLWPLSTPSSTWAGSLLIQITPDCDADQPRWLIAFGRPWRL